MTLLVAGSANLDFVVYAPRIAAPGETVLGHRMATFPGGKGANQAIACARAGGAATRMLLALGDDAHAAPIEASLRDAGVDLVVVRSPTEATGCAFISVADSAENAITVAPGANATLRRDHLPPLAGVSHLLMQLETPPGIVAAWARDARAAGVVVVLNAAPALPLPDGLLADLDWLIVNEGELGAVAGDFGADAGGSIAATMAGLPVPGVVVTLGHLGCIAMSQGRLTLQPAFPVDPVDTTAAGDTFCGVFAAALAEGDAVAAALRRASAAAAIACTRHGAQPSIPGRAEVDSLLASHRLADDAEGLARLALHCGIAADPPPRS